MFLLSTLLRLLLQECECLDAYSDGDQWWCGRCGEVYDQRPVHLPKAVAVVTTGSRNG